MNNEQIIATLQYLIGSRYVPSVKAYIAELTGRARVMGPGDFTSREFDQLRLTVDADAQGRISGFNFG